MLGYFKKIGQNAVLKPADRYSKPKAVQSSDELSVPVLNEWLDNLLKTEIDLIKKKSGNIAFILAIKLLAHYQT